MNYIKYPRENWEDICYEEKEEALPCPGCGHEAELTIGTNYYYGKPWLVAYAQCTYCAIKGKPYYIDSENISIHQLERNRTKAINSALKSWNIDGGIYEGVKYGR